MPDRIPPAVRLSAAAIAVALASAAASGAATGATAPLREPVVRIDAPRAVVAPGTVVVAQASPAAAVRSIEIRFEGRVVARTMGSRVRVTLSGTRLAAGTRRIAVVVRTTDGASVIARRAFARPTSRSRRPAAPPRATPVPSPLNEAPPGGTPGEEPPSEGPLSPFLSPLPGPPTWIGDFETGSFSQWTNRSGGVGVQRVADDRVRLVSAPVAQGTRAVRIEVRRGDRWRDSPGNRAELVKWTGEVEGDERWYQWSTLFPADYPRESSQWQIWTQWHTDRGGTQPMIKFWASDDTIGMSSTAATASGRPTTTTTHWTAPMDRGRWHTLRLHVRWSASRDRGFVELWHNGVQVVAPSPAATLVPGGSPNYLKQGLYRNSSIVPTAVVYHDAMSMSVVRKS